MCFAQHAVERLDRRSGLQLKAGGADAATRAVLTHASELFGALDTGTATSPQQ